MALRRPAGQYYACLTLLCGLVLLAGGCAQKPSSEVAPAPVRVATVQGLSAGNQVKYSASIVPNSQVDLAFRSGGYVASLKQVRGADGRTRSVDEGDFVKKGTVLAVVQQQEYQDKVQQAQAQLDHATAEYTHAKLQLDRTSALYSAQSATKPEYDQAQAQYDSAVAAVSAGKAGLSESKTALGYASLEVPFDGWIVKRNVDVGSLVNAATTGFVLASTELVKAVFGIPDFAISKIRLGQTQTIHTDTTTEEFHGRVTAISPAADPKSRVYSVEVTIPNPKNHLKSGMIASLALGGGLPAPTLAVPLSAVIRDPLNPSGFAVMVLDSPGESASVHSRAVQVGDSYGNLVAVNSGLKAGEQVVSSGATLLKSGDHVRVIPE
ncbi:MAG: efflux RND transporter periplasmic adaptor subunit [Acidobacteriales bacterium]|nr:efflux RND transporter periplasmic adaptor subunit [Terriglobales bacterium]